MKQHPDQILIIKHGALGDIILASGHIRTIDRAFSSNHIVCLTTKAYAPLLAKCPWIDEIWIDPKPRSLQLFKWFSLFRKLRSRRFRFVYDLQTSGRSSLYWWFVRRAPWSGIAYFASHKQKGKARLRMHSIDRLNHQLEMTGLHTDGGIPDIHWLEGAFDPFIQRIQRAHLRPGDPQPLADAIPPFALLVPGGSAHRPEKRWPTQHYISLARTLWEHGVVPVLVGTGAEREVLDQIAANVRDAVNLCERTDLGQLASLARKASWAVGNDTGPMHVIAATGCPSTVIFSHASDPARSAPRGGHVQTLRKENLTQLSLEIVWNSRPLALDSAPVSSSLGG